MVTFIKEHFSLDLDYKDIKEIKRIGKKSDRPRPIIVTFSTLGMKINIFKRTGSLKNTEFYIKEDYPPNILQKRKELIEQAQIEMEKGNSVMIKYDKLIIREKRTQQSKTRESFQLLPKQTL